MADQPAPADPTLLAIPRVRDPNYREIYSNNNLIGMGPFDLTITFQKISEVIPGQTGAIDMAAVSMSPQRFKAFVKAMAEVLSAYENSFGALSISEEDTKPMRTASEIEEVVKKNRELVARATAKSDPSSTEKKPPSKRSRGDVQH